MGSLFDISSYVKTLESGLAQAGQVYHEAEKQVSNGIDQAKNTAASKLDEVQKSAEEKLQQGKALLASVQKGVESEVKSIAATSSQTLENYKNAAKAAYNAYAEPVKEVADQSKSTVSIPKNLSKNAVANMHVSPSASTEPNDTSTTEVTNPIQFAQNVYNNFSYTGLLEYELSGLEAGAAALQAPYMQEVENGNLEALDSPHLKAGVAVYTGVQFVKAVAGGLGAISGTGEFIKQLPEASLEYVSDSISNGKLGNPVETLENTPHYNDARATLGFVGQVAELGEKGKIFDAKRVNWATQQTLNNPQMYTKADGNTDLDARLHTWATYYAAGTIIDGIEGTKLGAQVFLGDNPNLPWYLRAQNMAGSALGYVVPTRLKIKGEGAVLKEMPRETAPKTSPSLSEIDSKLFSETTQLGDEITDVGKEPTVVVEKQPSTVERSPQHTPSARRITFEDRISSALKRLEEIAKQDVITPDNALEVTAIKNILEYLEGLDQNLSKQIGDGLESIENLQSRLPQQP